MSESRGEGQLALYFLFVGVTKAQVPAWENPVQLPNTDYVVSATTDGFGSHILVPNGLTFKHRLLGNDGVPITSNSEQIAPPRAGTDADFGASLTNFGGTVSIVVRGNNSQLNLYQSSDGGASWSNAIVYNPGGLTFNYVDAFADARGIHIVWDNTLATKVYYVRYVPPPANQFVGFQEITNLNGTIIQGRAPRVVASAYKAVVSFVKIQTPLKSVGATRDYDFELQLWDNTDQPASELTADVETQTIVLRGSMVHMLMRRASGGSATSLWESRRDLYGNWSVPLQINTITPVPGTQFYYSRAATAVGDTAYCVYPENGFCKVYYYKVNPPWSQITQVVSASVTNEAISSSKSGVYVFYSPSSNATEMRRWALAITGSITTNGFWTGYTYVGNASIESGVTVTMKSNSLTTFMASAQLTVKSGATLIVEQNANLAMQSGSKIIVENGGIVKVQMNATLTIPSGGTLQANAGAQFNFSPSSGLLSYGQLNAYGSANAPVVFQSIYGGGGTWSGITLNGAHGSLMQYATVANVLTYWGSAVNVLDAKNISISNCNISGNSSNGTNGLFLYNSSDAMIGYNTINGNGGSGIKFDETGWANVFKNTIQNNANAGVYSVNSSMAFGTSPFYSPDGNNTIVGGAYGVDAQWYSYPWMGSVGNTWVGYNSVCSNSSHRVRAADYSNVAADVQWWGTKNPTSSLFLEENGGTVAWENFLDYDPNGTCSDDGLMNLKGNRGSVTTGVTDTNDVIFLALRERNNRNRNAARGLLQSAITSNPNSTQAVKAAAILSQMYRDSLDSDLFDMVNRIWQQRRTSHPVFGQAIAKMLHKGGHIADAATILNAVAASNRNTTYEKRALLSLFYMYCTSPRHANLSGSVLQELQTRYANDADVRHAAWIHGVANPSNSNLGKIAIEPQVVVHPSEYKLEQNYPNPFNPTTTIRFAIPQNEHVTLKVFDLLGREIASLVDESRNAGTYSETFDASRLASGVYVYKLTAGDFSVSKKLAVVK